MDWIGLGLVVLFYLIILFIGIWIARRKGVLKSDSWDEMVLANRQLSLGVGIFTLIATEVGGAFVNGTAEEVYKNGILWCLAPMCYALSMTINGLIFVPKLREKGYVTLIDSLQDSYGKTIGGLVYLPSCIGDICWTAAVLSALGTTLSVILDINTKLAISFSAIVAIVYTLIGGMYSVAYTDVIQIAFIFGGLWIAIPFMWTNENIDASRLEFHDWFGTIEGQISWRNYIDTFLMMICGGIPWQPYYQRALAVKTTRNAQILSVFATLGCFLFMIPPILIGVAIKSTENETLAPYNVTENPSLILPVSLVALTPYWISMLGLSAVSAAAMSSVDSSLLSGASYLTHNIYSGMIKQFKSTKTENILVFRISVLILGIASTVLSLYTSTIYGLWVLSGDLGYVIVFPQFLVSVFLSKYVNKYGSLLSAIVTFILRFLIGEPTIGLSAIIPIDEWIVPARTLLMLLSLTILLISSKLFSYVYTDQRMKSNT